MLRDQAGCVRAGRTRNHPQQQADEPQHPAPRGRPPAHPSPQSGKATSPPASRVQNSVRSKASIARHSRRPAPLPPPPVGRTTRPSGGAAPARIGWRGHSHRGHVSLRMTLSATASWPPGHFFFPGGVDIPGAFGVDTAVKYHRGFWVLALGTLVSGAGRGVAETGGYHSPIWAEGDVSRRGLGHCTCGRHRQLFRFARCAGVDPGIHASSRRAAARGPNTRHPTAVSTRAAPGYP